MKKILFAIAIALPLAVGACGNSKEKAEAVSLSDEVKADENATAEKNKKADYNSLSNEDKEKAVLAVIDELVFYDKHNETTYERCCTQNLRNKLAQGYGICGYADSDPDMPAEPVSVKITKFNPETGEVTYVVDVKWEDHYDNTSGTRQVEEKATFKVEDGEIKMDTNSGMQFYS